MAKARQSTRRSATPATDGRIYRAAADALLELLTGSGPRRAAPARRTRRAAIAPGSLEARLLELVAETPQPLAVLVDGAKARAYDVKRAIAALRVARRLEKFGGGRRTRYGLAG